MSAIASFYLLDASKLEALKDDYDAVLAANGRELKSNSGSGLLYSFLPAFFQQEKGIDLLQNEYTAVAQDLDESGSAHFIFTNSQRENLAHILSSENVSLNELQTFHQEFFGDEEEDIAALLQDAIQVLNDNLKEVKSDNDVLLLIVS